MSEGKEQPYKSRYGFERGLNNFFSAISWVVVAIGILLCMIAVGKDDQPFLIYGAMTLGAGLTWLLMAGITRAAFDMADNTTILLTMAQSYLPEDHPLKRASPDQAVTSTNHRETPEKLR